MQTYEQKLDADVRWALEEGGRHFMNTSDVHKTLRQITNKLNELHVPYAVVGGMAMFMHGFRRFTEDVDILVTKDGVQRIHEHLEGRGYLPPFAGSKNLRDTETGVRIEFLIAGQFPGDGKPKPVVFPDPADASVEIEGIRCIGLEKLIELKIASGSTTGRLHDLGDVQQLIRHLRLPFEFGQRLDPSVQGEYYRLWELVQQSPDQSLE